MGSMQKNKTADSLGAVQLLGVVIAILGILLTIYSGYLITAAPSGLQHRFSVNATAPNPNYQFNRSTTGFAYRSNPFASPSNILSGILLILLGIVTFKYGALKNAAESAKSGK